jgi:hypothetical protein
VFGLLEGLPWGGIKFIKPGKGGTTHKAALLQNKNKKNSKFSLILKVFLDFTKKYFDF